eukprot:6204796-Pleurochrysis_carterae.AAC.2
MASVGEACMYAERGSAARSHTSTTDERFGCDVSCRNADSVTRAPASETGRMNAPRVLVAGRGCLHAPRRRKRPPCVRVGSLTRNVSDMPVRVPSPSTATFASSNGASGALVCGSSSGWLWPWLRLLSLLVVLVVLVTVS